MSDRISIPSPKTAPFGTPVTHDGVQEVWDAFVKPEQDAGIPQSVEMRMLMAILRSVAAGMREAGESGAER